MKRRYTGRADAMVRSQEGEQGFWPSYADMMSAVALILFFLMLLSYISNMITGNNLKNTESQLSETRTQLAEKEKELLSLEDSLTLTMQQVTEAQDELDRVSSDLDQVRTSLEEKEADLAEQDKLLADQKALLSSQETRLSEQESKLADQEARLTRQQSLIGEQEEYLNAATEETQCGDRGNPGTAWPDGDHRRRAAVCSGTDPGQRDCGDGGQFQGQNRQREYCPE